MSASASATSGLFSSQNGGKKVTAQPQDLGNVILLLEGASAFVADAMAGVATPAEAQTMIEPTATLVGPRFLLPVPVFPAGGGAAQVQTHALAQFTYEKGNYDKYIEALKALKSFITLN